MYNPMKNIRREVRDALADDYLNTVDRLEPDIHPIDAAAFYASAAISLKRMADGKRLSFSNRMSLAAGVVLGVSIAVVLVKMGLVTP